MVTNLPMIFPLIKIWLKPWFGSALGSSKKAYDYKSSPFRTIGGGGASGGGTAYSSNRHRRGVESSAISENMTFNDSEENMVNDIKMQNIQTSINQIPRENQSRSGILVSNEVRITHEDRSSHGGTDNLSDKYDDTYHVV